MPFHMTNRGLNYFITSAVTSSTDIRMAVFKGVVPSAASIKDMNFLSDLTAVSSEAAAANYSRADLASLTITEDDTLDNVTITAAPPGWTNVAAGEVWTHVAYYVESGSDSTRVLLGVDDPDSDLITNGGSVTGPTLNITVSAS